MGAAGRRRLMMGGAITAIPLTCPIYPASNLVITFSEAVQNVNTVGDGTGTWEVYNLTTTSYIAGVLSSPDNIVWTFNPTADLTVGHNYEIRLSTAINGIATGTPYSGVDFTFTCEAAPYYRSNGNIYDDNCSSLTGWTNGDSGGSATTVDTTTYPGEAVFKMLTSSTPSGTNHAYRSRDVGTFGSVTTVSMRVNPAVVGTRSNNDRFLFNIENGSYRLWFSLSETGVEYFNGTSWVSTTQTITEGQFDEWGISVTWASKAIDIYKNGSLVQQITSNALQTIGSTNGFTQIACRGYTTGSQLSYIDFLKIGDSMVAV